VSNENKVHILYKDYKPDGFPLCKENLAWLAGFEYITDRGTVPSFKKSHMKY